MQAVPVFLNEVAPDACRGMYSSLFRLAYSVGYVCACIINALVNPWGWKLSVYLTAVPAACTLLFGFLLPETPPSLIERRRIDEGRYVLARLRGTSAIKVRQSTFQREQVLWKASAGDLIQHFRSSALSSSGGVCNIEVERGKHRRSSPIDASQSQRPHESISLVTPMCMWGQRSAPSALESHSIRTLVSILLHSSCSGCIEYEVNVHRHSSGLHTCNNFAYCCHVQWALRVSLSGDGLGVSGLAAGTE